MHRFTPHVAAAFLPRARNKVCALALSGILPLALSSVLSAQESYLRPQDKIMWIGDSITAQNLYETYVMRALKTLYPDSGFSDVNCGTGGATAPSQFAGIPPKVEQQRPTIMTAMFGVNDTGWSTSEPDKKIDAYRQGLQQYVELARAKHIPLLLLRETHFSHNKAGELFVDGQNAILAKLFAAQDKLAAAAGVNVVDTYGAYLRQLGKAWDVDPKYEFTPNVIHPTNLGHAAVAGEILRALGAGLPLAAGSERGPLHLDSKQPVELAAQPLAETIAPGSPLPITIRATSRTDRMLDGQLIVVIGEQKFARKVSVGAGASTTEIVELPPAAMTRRWEVQPIYMAFVGPGVFAADETPLYFSQLLPAQAEPFVPDSKSWVEWEGRTSLNSTVSDLRVRVEADQLRAEFTWTDATPVLAQRAPYKARLGEPVETPLDMTSPFGQPCDAVEMFLDLRDEKSTARYTSNMDSIPDGTARVGLYRIEQDGKPVCKLQVSPPALSAAFKLSESGKDRFAIEYRGPIPNCGVGLNFFVTDAKQYAPNKTVGAYLTSVPAVGTDWVDFFRVTAGQQGTFCRVGY